MNFIPLMNSYEEGNALQKWMKSKGHGEFSKLWNDCWKGITAIIFWGIPLFISFVTAVVIATILRVRRPIDKHEKTDVDMLDAIILILFFFIFLFTWGKN